MICSVADCQKENHPKYPTRCWAHRAKKWAEPVNEEFIASIRKYSFEAVEEEAVAEEAVAEEVVSEEVVSEEVVSEEVVSEEAVAEEAVAEEPIAEEPIAEEPIAEEPTVEEPTVEEAVADVAVELILSCGIENVACAPLDAYKTDKVSSFIRIESANEDAKMFAFARYSDACKAADCLKTGLSDMKIKTMFRKPVAQASGPFDCVDADEAADAAMEREEEDDYEDEDEDEKNDDLGLIPSQEKIVQSDIVPPMSPNSSSIQATPAILEQPNVSAVEKLFDLRECFNVPGNEYQYWIDKSAIGRVEVSMRLKLSNGNYIFDIDGCRVLQMVCYSGDRTFRKFVWFYNLVDMFAFIKFFHSSKANTEGGVRPRQFECHEVFVGKDPAIKLFLDIEKVIPTEYYNSKNPRRDIGHNDLGYKICSDLMKAIKNALEMVDRRYERYESEIDYAIVSRCRPVNDTETKISYHLITNIAMRVSECKAVVKLMKEEYLDTVASETKDPRYQEMLCDKTTIDTNPYRLNGSLSLPGGRKKHNQLKIIKPFERSSMNLHLLDIAECTSWHDFSEDLPIKSNQNDREAFEDSSPEFITKALAELDEKAVPAYDPSAMDLYANPPRGNYLYVRRTAPSHCPECDRTHDSADTLLLIFNEQKKFALWKCSHNEDMKAQLWYGKFEQKEFDFGSFNDDDIEAFARSKSPKSFKSGAEINRIKAIEHKNKTKGKTKKQIADEGNEPMSQSEALAQLPAWDIENKADVVPPLNDPHNPCCYSDYLTLVRKPISGKEAMKYISNNFAMINNGGDAFLITKNFNRDAHGNKSLSYKYIKYKQVRDIPGALQIALRNPRTNGVEINTFPLHLLIKHWEYDITYSEMRFNPFGAKIGYDWSNKDVFNTFTGFVHQYDPDFTVDQTKFAQFLTHIREAWCDSDEDLYDFTIKLLAYMVQFPHLKTAVAMIIMGPEGLGKNFVMEIWRDYIIGHQYMLETPSIESITNKFNAGLEGNLMVVLNEAAKVNRSIESNKSQEVVKDLITERRRRYERKGCEAYMGECFNNVVMFSNNDYVVRASTEMRRFVFYKGSGKFIGKQAEHFGPIKKAFESDEAGIHLYHYLMSIDLDEFHPQRSAPSTTVKEELKKNAIEKPIQWMIACINNETNNTFIYGPEVDSDGNPIHTFYSSEALLSIFNSWMEKCGERSDMTLKVFAKTLTKYFEVAADRKRIKGIRSRGFTLSIAKMKELIAQTTRRDDLFDEEKDDE